MDTSRDDISIAFRSAFLSKGTKQKFSLLALVILSILLIFFEKIELKPLNYFRSFVKDTIYRGSLLVSIPGKSFSNIGHQISDYLNLHSNYQKIKEENKELKDQFLKRGYLELENDQLRKLIEDRINSESNLVSARVVIDKQSPYLNSFIINIGSNKKIKNGMAVLDGNFFVGRIIDVNFFSSRVLLVKDLNSKIPVISEPSGVHGILSGHGKNEKPTIEFLPENNSIKEGDKVYTSGKEGIFQPGIPVGEVKFEGGEVNVLLFSNLDQISFVSIDTGILKDNY